MPLPNPFRRAADRPSLKERAAALRADLAGAIRRPAPEQPEPVAPPPTSFQDQVALAGAKGDVLAACGVDHRDGTASYADAAGRVVRRPIAHWIAFNSQQMHLRVQQEIGRRRALETTHLDAEAHGAWDAEIRRELRSDAVFALAFRPERAFQAEQDFRSGTEPASKKDREASDVDLLALAKPWADARDAFAEAIQHVIAVSHAADGIEAPPSRDLPHEEWLRLVEGWRERTGVEDAENAAGDAASRMHEIEDRIATTPAASLAGLKLKALVAQRHSDNDLVWPDGLGAGLVRDILALAEWRADQPAPITVSLAEQIDFASATMDELQTIRDLADRLGDVAYAHLWSPRCQRRVNVYGVPDYNDAGKLMQRIGDALTSVEAAAEAEATRRAPNDPADCETRLSMLAVTTIDNGDPDKTAAFAREMLAYSEAERTRD